MGVDCARNSDGLHLVDDHSGGSLSSNELQLVAPLALSQLNHADRTREITEPSPGNATTTTTESWGISNVSYCISGFSPV